MNGSEKRRRRQHSAAFKAEAVAACRQPGVSLSAVALQRQVNANLMRRWVKESFGKTAVAPVKAAASAPRAPVFLPLELAVPKPAAREERPIRVQLRKRGLRITIEWPTTVAGSCAAWLRELLG